MNDELHSYDLIIIGAGPIGLAAACAAQDYGLRYVCIDKRGICQTLSEFAPRQSFYSPADELEIGGVPFPIASDEKPRREDALAYYRAVVSSRKLNMRTWERAIGLQRRDGMIELETEQEPDHAWRKTYRSSAVLLASGVWDQPRRLDVPGDNLKKVRIRYEDPVPYYGKQCLVVGGGNSAAEVAMALARAGATTEMALIEDSWDSCRLRPFVMRELLLLIDEKRIEVMFSTRVTKIETDCVYLAPSEGPEFALPNDFVFTMIGNVPDAPFLRGAEIELHPDDLKPVYDETTFETNVPGIYVAGSISREPHIFNGRGRAVKIVEQIARKLRPETADLLDQNSAPTPLHFVSEADAPVETSVG